MILKPQRPGFKLRSTPPGPVLVQVHGEAVRTSVHPRLTGAPGTAMRAHGGFRETGRKSCTYTECLAKGPAQDR